MPLLNYTTTIKPDKTASEIQAKLAKAGASQILTEFREGLPVALSFVVGTEFGPRAYRLPVDPEPVLKVLDRQAWKREIPNRYVNRAQAERVAWRIVKDWTEAQLAIIETQMVTLAQVMLPYMTTESGATAWEALKAQRLQLGAGASDRVLEAEVVTE